ncbi:hypothetical protein [Amphritea sp. HPY]|uniref:hypothetical protein n=1 Tax=Amphritea sp. HPY TaxID=3421652 RepID=UPI003D7EC43F
MKTLTIPSIFIATALIAPIQTQAGLMQLGHNTAEQNGKVIVVDEKKKTVNPHKFMWDEDLYTQ